MRRIFTFLLCALVLNTGLAMAQTPYETLVTYRQQYPTPMSGLQAAALLNRVAWDFRDQGMKLLGKAGGENCPMPNGVLISCDFLVHAPTLTGHDVMSGAQGGAGSINGFVWGPGPEPLADAIASGARTLVDPIQPSTGNIPPVVTPPTPPAPPVPDLQTQILYELMEHERLEAVERQQAAEFRAAVGHEYQKFFVFVAKYILPAVGAIFVGKGIAK